MAYSQKGEPKVWRWRLRARSSDGQMVTLGKYDTEAEARQEHDKIIKDKSYRNVSVEEIPIADRPADPGATP